MTPKARIPISIVLVLLGSAFVAPTASADDHVTCQVEDFHCTCTREGDQYCEGIFTERCTTAYGVHRDLMIGLDCAGA